MMRMILIYMFVSLLTVPICSSRWLPVFARDTAVKSPSPERLRRSPKFIGDAGKALLNGAIKIPSNMKGYKYYEKKGTASKAVREFMTSVNPETLLEYRSPSGVRILMSPTKRGYIAYNPEDMVVGNKPTITIWERKTDSETGIIYDAYDKIIYK